MGTLIAAAVGVDREDGSDDDSEELGAEMEEGVIRGQESEETARRGCGRIGWIGCGIS